MHTLPRGIRERRETRSDPVLGEISASAASSSLPPKCVEPRACTQPTFTSIGATLQQLAGSIAERMYNMELTPPDCLRLQAPRRRRRLSSLPALKIRRHLLPVQAEVCCRATARAGRLELRVADAELGITRAPACALPVCTARAPTSAVRACLPGARRCGLVASIAQARSGALPRQAAHARCCATAAHAAHARRPLPRCSSLSDMGSKSGDPDSGWQPLIRTQGSVSKVMSACQTQQVGQHQG